MLLVALPVLLVVGLRSYYAARIASATEADGTFRYFGQGPAREILDAIDRNDAAAVTRLAPRADLDARGLADMTLLVYALRRLAGKPHELEPLGALLAAGADPNRAADELPLTVAIQRSRDAGPEPVAMLLAAGANPNTMDQFGAPAYFMAAGRTIPLDVLRLLLDRGADLALRDRQGRSIAFGAATAANWPAVLLLLQRGVNYDGRSINGETFVEMVESHIRVFGDTAGAAEVLAYLRRVP
jgi:ankyrin repeat protein